MPRDEHELDLEEHLDAQRRGWRVDRASWVVIGALILGALLGAFGEGPLSDRTISTEGGLQLSYGRFGRKGADSVLTFRLPGGGAREGASLWVGAEYFEGVKVDGITPTPDTVKVLGDGFLYTFLTAEDDTSPLVVRFDLTAADVGFHAGRFSSGAPETAVDFDQFFYP
ncbi:MAG: hypothetical protein ABR529_12100 [Actinomycetota bacterium]